MGKLIVKSIFVLKVAVVFLLFVFTLGNLSSCTLSMVMTDTHGTASDVVDENQQPTADVKADISVPVSLVPNPVVR